MGRETVTNCQDCGIEFEINRVGSIPNRCKKCRCEHKIFLQKERRKTYVETYKQATIRGSKHRKERKENDANYSLKLKEYDSNRSKIKRSTLHGYVDSLCKGLYNNARRKNIQVPQNEDRENFEREIIKLAETTLTCKYFGAILKYYSDSRSPYQASLDHKFPVSLHPDKYFNIENIQWISLAANRAKGNCTHDEFLKFLCNCFKEVNNEQK